MFRLPTFRFEQFSFILGLLAGALLWWIISKVRGYVPAVKKEVKEQKEVIEIKKQTGINEIYKRELFVFSQKQHLASRYFSLNEILIEPDFLAPPYVIDPTIPLPPETLTSQIVPYLPDWPEFVSQYPYPRISILETLRNGVNIVVYGQAGTGKSTALAHLVSQITRPQSQTVGISSRIPIYLHYLDIDFDPKKPREPIEILLSAVANKGESFSKPQFISYLRSSSTAEGLLLILDGLDELSPRLFREAVQFLEYLSKNSPNIQFITTSSADYLDGFSGLEVHMLCMASWDQYRRKLFLKKWNDAWVKYVLRSKLDKNLEEGYRLLDHWLLDEEKILNPFEWTIKAWSGYYGNLQGASTSDLIDAFISLVGNYSFTAENLATFTNELINQGNNGFKYSHAEKLLSRSLKSSDALPNQNEIEDASTSKNNQKKKIASSGDLIIRALVNYGIANIHSEDFFSIHQPLIVSYASSHIEISESLKIESPYWSYIVDRLRFVASKVKDHPLLDQFIENEDLPLHRNLLVAGRFMKDSSPDSRWRISLMRRLVYLSKQETLPTGLRTSFLAVAAFSYDSSLSMLFKQLFTSPSPSIRRSAALSAGISKDQKCISDLINLLSDPSLEVRCSACLALSLFEHATSIKAVNDALLKGEEHLQQIAAETLAADPLTGHEILKNAVTFDNILVRRAAVIGLSQIRERWSASMLEKIAVEDNQWVVRNAASQALEMLHQNNVYAPRPLPRPSDAPWLISLAGKQGYSLTADEIPTTFLLQALKSGNFEEKAASLYYLRQVPQENVLKSIYDTFYGQEPQLQEIAFQVLWFLVMSGLPLPNPSQFGMK
jgi:hypothetical protein